MKVSVFDLHCDTADKLAGFGENGPENLDRNTAHIDLERAGGLCGYAQCFACFTSVSNQYNPVDVFEKKLAAIHRELAKNFDRIRQVYTPDEIDENRKNGLYSAILTIEGPAGFGFDPELLEDLYKIGFRITTLGWNEKNPLTGSCVTGGGLTDLGREYVKEAQRLGMIVDVSHISDEGFWDIMDITGAPIVATHSNSRFCCNVSRNLTDDMFFQICKTDGVAGINLYSAFVGEDATLDAVCDHVFHYLDLDPSGKHIALGGDLDGCDTLPNGFSGIQDYPKFADCLRDRGLSEEMIHDIFWNNALGVMKRCCM